VDIHQAVRAVVVRLEAAGLRAVCDERDVNPPCVYVPPPSISWRFRRGDFDAAFTAWCVVPNSGRDIALRNLGPLVTAAAAALGMAVITAVPGDLVVPELAAPLPAYLLTWSECVRQPVEVSP
jgi:hypothetical protein